MSGEIASGVFGAYLHRHEHVSGGAVSFAWSGDGTGLSFVQETAGQAVAVHLDDRIPPRTWKRCQYLTDEVLVPEQLSGDGSWFASIQAHDIVLRSVRDGRQRNLTADGTPERFWDIEAESPYGEGWLVGGRARPASWSPDDLTLLAYRRDVSGVFRIPRLHWLSRFEAVDHVPFQKAGGRLDRIAPAFIDVQSGRRTWVQLDSAEDCYVQWLAWSPSGSEALLVVYTRDLRSARIVAADRSTGIARTVMTETADTPVRIQLDEVWMGVHGFQLMPDGRRFLWLSSRDGWNHLYLYDMSGELVAQLTSGPWRVYAIVQVTRAWVYFTGAIDVSRPYDVHVCRVPAAGGAVEQLTREKGIHSPVFAPGAEFFIDSHSAVDRPVRTELRRADGVSLRLLSEMDIRALRAFGYAPPEEFVVLAADGKTELWGVMYKPSDFDGARVYPVVEFIYGGPQCIAAQRTFSVHRTQYENLPWALAQLGYVTVCLDARGTPGRSREFQDVVQGNWIAGIFDHAAAIRQLCERHPWMDRERVGIAGHSWGGYFATCALIHASDTYHAAVAYEPGYDPWHQIIYEPYLGLPQENAQAYEQADLIAQAGRIRGQLMILTGTSYNLTAPTAIRMVRALIEAGIDHEVVLVPEAFHRFAGAEEDLLIRKHVAWLDRHVKHRARP